MWGTYETSVGAAELPASASAFHGAKESYRQSEVRVLELHSKHSKDVKSARTCRPGLQILSYRMSGSARASLAPGTEI